MGGWVAGWTKSEIKAISVQLQLGLGLSLAKTTNQPSPEVALGAKNVIGGGLGYGSDPANGGSQ